MLVVLPVLETAKKIAMTPRNQQILNLSNALITDIIFFHQGKHDLYYIYAKQRQKIPIKRSFWSMVKHFLNKNIDSPASLNSVISVPSFG